jgi:shikimate dehydrogenase
MAAGRQQPGTSAALEPAKTYLAGLIGAGIGPSLSPPLHEHEAAALGLRYAYRLIDIGDAGLTATDTPGLIRSARLLGFDGLNITHPCKQAAVGGVDELSAEAAALGAVNTVVFRDGRAAGHNTDWSGFARSLRRGLPGAALGHVVVLGAGGAGAAASYALARLGAGRVTVIDTDESRAAALTASLAPVSGDHRIGHTRLSGLVHALAGADGLVHATPTGMAAHPGTAVPAGALRPGLWVADIVYRPLETELVRAARKAGCRTLDGGGMAVFQAADAFALFTGTEPDTGRMIADFARLTAAEADHDHRSS